MTQELSESEKLAHARERAVETYRYDPFFEVVCEVSDDGCGLGQDAEIPAEVVKAAVRHGWDAALEWARVNSNETLQKVLDMAVTSLRFDEHPQEWEESIKEIRDTVKSMVTT